MAAGDVVRNMKCGACGFANVPVKEGKGGSLSSHCPNPKCGAQLIIRSPTGVQTFREFVEGPAAGGGNKGGQAGAGGAVKQKSFSQEVFGEDGDGD
jgi:hypothetical protein